MSRADRFIHRRTVLHGLAATVTLPLLDAMLPFGRSRAAASALADGAIGLGAGSLGAIGVGAGAQSASALGAAATGAAPRRLIWLFIPNGVEATSWAPRGNGHEWRPDGILEPIASVREHVSVFSNLCHRNASALGDGPGDHARSAACFLTGVHPRKTAGDDIQVGVSADQIAARALAGTTRFDSLELGLEQGMESGNCDSGYSCAYSGNVSWRGPSTPNAKETSPRELFERLFGGGAPPKERARRRALRQSILDHAQADAARLDRALGAGDRRRVAEFLEGVRDVERRIEAGEAALPDPADFGLEAPRGTPTDHREHLRLMLDLLIVAMRIDATRVATFMYANEGTNRPYPFLDIRDGHHDISHHGGDAAKMERFRRIGRFQVEEYARFVQKLAETPDGEGTLLDHALVAFGGAIRDGNRHDHDDLPVIVAGRGAGVHVPGGHRAMSTGTPLCNLWLAMARSADSTIERQGDSTGALTLS